MNDSLIYVLHAGVWTAFLLARQLARRGASGAFGPKNAAVKTAPWSRALVAFHTAGFAVLYFGLSLGVFAIGAPKPLPIQRDVGEALIIGSGALMCWALLYFRSWRLRARLDAGHELATGGPYAFLRHPIYGGIDLLALGTAIWVPAGVVIFGAILLIIGGDLRARAEERVLIEAFGQRYLDYMQDAKRLIPGVY